MIVAEGHAIDGSARILEWIEARWPQPALFPTDATDRAEALRIQHWFDEDLTPRIRRAVLDALLRQPTAFAGVFGDGRPPLQRLAYAIAVPLAAPLVRKGNGIARQRRTCVGDGLTSSPARAHGRLDFDRPQLRAERRSSYAGRRAGASGPGRDLDGRRFDAGRFDPTARFADGRARRPVAARPSRAAAAALSPRPHPALIAWTRHELELLRHST